LQSTGGSSEDKVRDVPHFEPAAFLNLYKRAQSRITFLSSGFPGGSSASNLPHHVRQLGDVGGDAASLTRSVVTGPRTILKEAEQHVGSKYVDQVLDSLYVIEMAMRHFYVRAEMGKNAGRKEVLVDQDYKDAATLAALVAPYRHARLSAMKLAGDQNSPLRIRDDASADEIRAEIMKRLAVLTSAGLIDPKALPVPDGGIANQSIRGGD
jgi:hypothetical protein